LPINFELSRVYVRRGRREQERRLHAQRRARGTRTPQGDAFGAKTAQAIRIWRDISNLVGVSLGNTNLKILKNNLRSVASIKKNQSLETVKNI